jgi:DNA-binding protein H-NS
MQCCKSATQPRKCSGLAILCSRTGDVVAIIAIMIGGIFMTNDFEALNADELYLLHLQLAAVLRKKLEAKKNALEERLRQLQPPDDREITQSNGRRPYPAVDPKFRNPDQPSETWSGRGKRPRWLVAQLKSGKRIDDFRIDRAASWHV